MDPKVKVLVSGAGGDVGQGVLKALMASTLNIELYATCIRADSSWLHKAGLRGFIAPLSADVGYIDYLIHLINHFGIQVYFPTVDSEILKIAQAKSRIESETGAIVFVDDLNKVGICDDKFQTAEFLRSHGFPYPTTIMANDPRVHETIKRIGFPLIVKKRSGKGGQHVYLVNTPDALTPYLGDADFIVQERLDPLAGEYTSGVYMGDDNKIKGICTFRRQLRAGSTYIAERIIDPVLELSLEKMARTLGMKYLNVQSILRDDELVPFEFNGRLSGSTAMVAKVFNAPEMFIRERLLGEELMRVDNVDRFVAMRYYQEIYASQEELDALIVRSSEI